MHRINRFNHLFRQGAKPRKQLLQPGGFAKAVKPREICSPKGPFAVVRRYGRLDYRHLGVIARHRLELYKGVRVGFDQRDGTGFNLQIGGQIPPHTRADMNHMGNRAHEIR